MITTIKFAKVNENAIIPTKIKENVGLDIYACFEEDYITISPQRIMMIPTGIAAACDSDYGIIIKERGSTGIKGMSVRAGVIDSGYRGEIFVAINNTGTKPIIIIKKKNNDEKFTIGDCEIYPYDKAIAQLLVIPVPQIEIEEYTYDELCAINSKRGNGALGSSGK